MTNKNAQKVILASNKEQLTLPNCLLPGARLMRKRKLRHGEIVAKMETLSPFLPPVNNRFRPIALVNPT
ncbi:hypothetical protein [Rhodobacter aestuarii]|uniref:hypothetical protein n=1 Tax=Rhodobacter aestuarii TaxID=453582 RepID=UPI000970D1C3|nr:hypothetical protein [Rhodobacter aestuarii]